MTARAHRADLRRWQAARALSYGLLAAKQAREPGPDPYAAARYAARLALISLGRSAPDRGLDRTRGAA